jgi:hypothetical protein
MRLTDIRVRNFRSIEAEQHLPIPGHMTLVGPNNSGKTNLLRAIQVLFTGNTNSYGYSRDADLTFGAGRARTSITATFNGDPETEVDIYESIDELHSLQGTERIGSQLPLTLYFTDTNTPVYSFFPNIKRPQAKTQAAQFSRTHIALVNRLLSGFSLHYVPSAKSVNQIYLELLAPYLRREVSKVILPYLPEIDKSLKEAADALNAEPLKANLIDYKASFSLPGESVEALVSGFDFMIADPQKTPIHEKGMGVQTTALLAAFRWITKQENLEGKQVIWLLEEPESYLHPHLANNCNSILENLTEDATVVKTTHSMAFVPQDPRYISGTRLNAKNNRTEIENYKTFTEAVSAIRDSLGIKFSDFYNLAKFNVLVEGPSDRELFTWVLGKLPLNSYPLPFVRQAKFEDFGGVKHLSGFLRSTYQFIRLEYACIAVFDGDEAGEREWRALQGYFGQNSIPFHANKNFVSVRSRFSIEGLFPDDWIKSIYSEHSSWFDSYAVDASGQLEPFKVKDDKKSNIQSKLISFAEAEGNLKWADSFVNVCTVMDSSLKELHIKLSE